MSTARAVSRRQILRGAGAVAFAAAATPILAACGDNPTAAGVTQANNKLAMPTYVPYSRVTPDLPAGQDLLPGFFRYPADLVTAFPSPPAAGAGTVNLLVDTFTPVPPALGSNRFWQAVNAKVGADLRFNMVPDSDYTTKVATTLAGGDLPDIVMLPSWTPQLPQVLRSLFADLTEFVSADAVKAYPFLANIPTFSWRPMVFNGGIYGLPTPRASIGSIMFTRDDTIARLSLNGAPKDYPEFLDLCRGLTDAKAGRWALGNAGATGGGAMQFALEIAGAPNGWQEQGGTLVNAVTTDAYKQALDIVSSMVKEGLFHPDTFSGTFQQQRDWFGTGKVGLTLDGYAAWDIFVSTYPGINVGGMVAPAYRGGASRHFTGSGSYAVTAIRKGSASRVKQLLRVCDWMAAPLGTAEQLFRKFGTAGSDYTMVDGAPVATSTGTVETKIPMQYVVDAAPTLGPGRRDVVQKQYDFHKKVAPILLADPTVGLYSPTNASKGAAMNKILTDSVSEILRGNKPVSSWDETARGWRAAGGDQVTKELQQAYAQLH
ncbi:MAG TPA: extracellular solute-binding protein [Rugosimonospora sp.]